MVIVELILVVVILVLQIYVIFKDELNHLMSKSVKKAEQESKTDMQETKTTLQKGKTLEHESKKGKQESIIDDKESNIGVLLQILPNIQSELITLCSYKVKADQFDQLKSERDTLKENNTNLFKDNESLQSESAQKDKDLAERMKEIEKQNKSNTELLNKVKQADGLKDYAENVVEYLTFCKIILERANERISASNKELMLVASPLLQKALMDTTEMSRWKQICEDIKEQGLAIQNKVLKNCFQYSDVSEQLSAFKKMCISKMIFFTNAVLILCEGYSKLSRFAVSDDEVSDDLGSIEKEFSGTIEGIKREAKKIGIIEIAGVKLFTPLDDYKEITSTNGSVSYPYSGVINLQKDYIVEIIEFGMKTEFEEMTKTKVIIHG